jgi:hypothetical protein
MTLNVNPLPEKVFFYAMIAITIGYIALTIVHL